MVDSPTETRVRLFDWLALAFWPLWALVLVLQVLDVGSVVLAFQAGSPVRELNPILLALAARTTLVVALAVKFAAIGLWLVLVRTVWRLCARQGWRVGTLLCTLLVALAGVWSAWVFWQTFVAAVIVR